jgi:endonuclease YncB( thermonuclease family)
MLFPPPRLARATAVLSTAAVLMTACHAARASGCADLAVYDAGQVAAIVDDRSLRLADGREVKLAGIEPIEQRRTETRATLDALLGRTVSLHVMEDGPDRYGREPAIVYIGSDPVPVQGLLLASGNALVGLGSSIPECRSELRATEKQARRAKKGAWADPAVTKNAENPDDILTRIGRFTVVEGKVVSVRETGATLYLNFGRRWTKGFAVTISRRRVGAFEAAGLAPKSLENKRIVVRGWVERRTGPVIAVREVGQIELAGGD